MEYERIFLAMKIPYCLLVWKYQRINMRQADFTEQFNVMEKKKEGPNLVCLPYLLSM